MIPIERKPERGVVEGPVSDVNAHGAEVHRRGFVLGPGVGDGAAGGFDLLKHGLGVLQKPRPCREELHAFGGALEEWGSELLFQVANLSGERRLTDVKPGRRPTHVAFLYDGDKVFDLRETHGVIP